MVPVGGSALTVLLETIFAPPLERRREKWFGMLAEAVAELQRTVQGISPEALAANEMFVTAAAQATQVALRTHQEEKLQALKRAVICAASADAPAEDQQLMFLRFIDELTPWHLRLLAFFNSPEQWLKDRGQVASWSLGAPSTVLEHCFPDLNGQSGFYVQLVRDLQSRGLIHQGEFLNTTMTGRGMLEARTTPFGRAFLVYISEPST